MPMPVGTAIVIRMGQHNMAKKNNQLASQIVPLLRQVFSVPSSGATVMSFSHGDRGWTLNKDEARLFEQAVGILASACPKVHLTTCMRELQRFCCERIQQRDAAFEQHLSDLFTRLDALASVDNVIYLEVSGIQLEYDEWSLGPVRFIHSEHPEIDRLRLGIQDINGEFPPPVDSGLVLARMEVKGEPEYAKHDAVNRVQLALDYLQALTLPENPAGIDGGYGYTLAYAETLPDISCRHWMYSSLEPTWSSGTACAPGFTSNHPKIKCRINASTMGKLEERGLRAVGELLSTSSPQAFDVSLLLALQWLGHAVRERDCTRKFLACYISLEALFTREDSTMRDSPGYSAPAMPVSDGVAFLLGKPTVEARMRIAGRVRELSRTRNRVVHRGYTSVEKNDLLQLAQYAFECCVRALKMRDQLQGEQAFTTWLQAQKYS